MHFRFGSKNHVANEIWGIQHTKRYKRSQRGRRISTVSRLNIQGTVKASTEADLHAAIGNIENSYLLDLINSGEAGLVHSDGTPTEHYWPAVDAMNGIEILQLDWPEWNEGEYATGRTFSIVLQAEFRQAESQLLWAEETLQFEGNTGPDWYMQESQVDLPYRDYTQLYTPQRIIQQGYTLGYEGYVLPPPPLFGYEKERRRIYTPMGPRLRLRNGDYEFGWRYSYAFEMPTYNSGFPTVM